MRQDPKYSFPPPSPMCFLQKKNVYILYYINNISLCVIFFSIIPVRTKFSISFKRSISERLGAKCNREKRHRKECNSVLSQAEEIAESGCRIRWKRWHNCRPGERARDLRVDKNELLLAITTICFEWWHFVDDKVHGESRAGERIDAVRRRTGNGDDEDDFSVFRSREKYSP